MNSVSHRAMRSQMSLFLRVAITFGSIFFGGIAAAAPIDYSPSTILFGGSLADTANNPYNGNAGMRFGLYAGGARVWYSQYNSVSVSNGQFQVALGGAGQGGLPIPL